MRTTININDDLLASARKYTGEKEKTKLVQMGLEALIQSHVAKRLIALGGTMPHLEISPRRRRLAKNGK
jgi:Arc/MetJ family transcription regulator